MKTLPIPVAVRLFALALAVAGPAAYAESAANINPAGNTDQGRRIYLEGLLPDNQPVTAWREGVGTIAGHDAACVNCHRPSGLGTVEGNIVIPPITGRALFGEGNSVTVRANRRFQPGVVMPHAPFTAIEFANAMRQGQHPTGRQLASLMPRYSFSDQALRDLGAYLGSLSTRLSPGVTPDEIRLATVIQPGMSAPRSAAFKKTLETAIAQTNVNTLAGLRKKIPVIERREKSRRRLVLDIWELTGPADTWPGQLARHQASQPVFAILSGLGNDWAPVQNFCDSQQVACWFPSIDATPDDAERSPFSLYYTRGTRLEGDIIAREILRTTPADSRVIQIVSDDYAERIGAHTVQQRLARSGIRVEIHALDGPTSRLSEALSAIGPADHGVLWLRSADLSRLPAMPPTSSGRIWLSGLLGGDARTLPDTWRQQAVLVQPLEYPAMRQANLARFNEWLHDRKLPNVDERMQSEVYFAVNFLSAALTSMLNNLHTDYLIERAEAMLSMRETMLVQEEIQALSMAGGGRSAVFALPPSQRNLTAETANALERQKLRRGNTAYPLLSLAAGQRIATQGAYLMPLNAPSDGDQEPEWVVP